MQIRAARQSEASAIRALAQRAYGKYVERIGRRPAPMDEDYVGQILKGNVFVAVQESGVELVGFIVLLAGADHMSVENVAVAPANQSEGIGRALLNYADALALAAGKLEMRLYTNAAMQENLELYSQIGYRVTDRRHQAGFDRVFLSKPLH
jgi:ribosomal protein S18 acetylase RimI-like enzyme